MGDPTREVGIDAGPHAVPLLIKTVPFAIGKTPTIDPAVMTTTELFPNVEVFVPPLPIPSGVVKEAAKKEELPPEIVVILA